MTAIREHETTEHSAVTEAREIPAQAKSADPLPPDPAEELEPTIVLGRE